MSLALAAMQFAREKHRAQRRKYTGNPYFDHLAEVAGIVASVSYSIKFAPMKTAIDTGFITHEQIIAVCFLHDCVEDQGVTRTELEELFGDVVAQGVMQLSDMEIGNRATRKMLGRVRLEAAPCWIQTIKCADLISNTSSIVQHDPKFAVTYLEEKRQLLDVMLDAHPVLREMAYSQVA